MSSLTNAIDQAIADIHAGEVGLPSGGLGLDYVSPYEQEQRDRTAAWRARPGNPHIKGQYYGNKWFDGQKMITVADNEAQLGRELAEFRRASGSGPMYMGRFRLLMQTKPAQSSSFVLLNLTHRHAHVLLILRLQK